jgi:hypothetical protein
MYFENITANNYTKIIEDEFTEFIMSSPNGPIFMYQKFAIELSQYINNVSVLIQDINDPTNFTDDNSWEMAIVNCSNDDYGTPNSNEALGVLKKPHPLMLATHWEVFDFKNSQDGPIYLNITNTNKTNENGIEKYWFAFRIKIPTDDTIYGGGPKFLYFNPDGGEADNKGEGDTFAISPDFVFDNYTVNHVKYEQVLNGTKLRGDLDSFKEIDDDRYLATDSNNLTLDIKFELEDLKHTKFSYYELYLKSIFSTKFNWYVDHWKYIFSIDISITTNISNIENIQSANLSIYNYKMGAPWIDLSYMFNITQENETSLFYSIRDPIEKIFFLAFMNNRFPNDNNTLRFKLEYLGNGNDFNVSINQFKIDIRELETLDTIQLHDPLIQDLYFTNNVTTFNGTTLPFGDQTIESLKYPDSNYYKSQALTSNVSLEFDFNVLNNIDNSLWDVDFYDWIASYPNPIIPKLEIRVTSNVSHPDNLNCSVLEVYKGNKTSEFFSEEQNNATWFQIGDLRQYAYLDETTYIQMLDAGFTWIILDLLNSSENNQIKFRLRYLTNSTSDYGFNVSINEFTLNFYIQNAISSDLASTIGFGINSNSLTPSDIKLKNFGQDITDIGFRNGIWEADIDDGTPFQGYFTFNVSSLWPSISFNVNGTYEIYQVLVLIEFIDTPSNQYMTGHHLFSVRVTGGTGTSLENLDIIFEILDSNSAIIFDTTARTNLEGIASANLDFSTTGDKYLIQVRFVQDGIYLSSEIRSVNIRIVDNFILFMDTFLQLLPYMIAILAGLFIFIALKRHKTQKLRRIWSAEAMILDDLVNISYILIIHKEVGVSIYNKQTALEGLDSDLISGFLQAISQFRHEFSKGAKDLQASKGFEMDYYDFKIIIVDGDFARVALILDKSPSDQLKYNQTAFANAFEVKFRPYLENFTGDITPFRETDSLIEKYFNIALMYPLKLASYRDVFKLNTLEKVLLEVAEQIQKERKFFFVSSLLSFGIAGRKESRDQIISSILSLKNKGILVPVEIK